MSSESFSLKPSPPSNAPVRTTISGTIGRRANMLSLRYAFLGPLSKILTPASADMPARRNALWEETCFELFLAPEHSDRYWEFNLSPSRHWNVYRFDAYRQGMQEEPVFTSLPFFVATGPGILELSLDVDLERIIPEGILLHAGISAIIRMADGDLTYWALNHPGPQPDFHRRENFAIDL